MTPVDEALLRRAIAHLRLSSTLYKTPAMMYDQSVKLADELEATLPSARRNDAGHAVAPQTRAR